MQAGGVQPTGDLLAADGDLVDGVIVELIDDTYADGEMMVWAKTAPGQEAAQQTVAGMIAMRRLLASLVENA